MRSPAAMFDLKAALTKELRLALGAINATPLADKSVHKCRVHLKRARALARVGRSCAPGLAGVFNESARGVMRSLSPARDFAALAQCARKLAKKERRKRAAALDKVATNLDAARARLAPAPLESVRAGLRDLLALAQVWPEPSARQIANGAERIARRARQARAAGSNARGLALRHEWRKREKDRYYAAEILGPSWPKDRKRRSKQSERLGEALGRERDALMLAERLAGAPELAGDLPSALLALRALRKHKRRLAARSNKLGARMHRGGA